MQKNGLSMAEQITKSMNQRIFSVVVLALCVFPIITNAQSEKTWTDHYWNGPDGIEFHYVEQGEGVPVILLHGFGSSSVRNWFNIGIAQELAKTNRVIAIDMRGHGDTPRAPEKCKGNMLEDVIALMDYLHIEKAHIGGYSMGGANTIGLLKLAPERFITASILGAGVPASEGWVKSVIRGSVLESDPKLIAPIDLSQIKFPVLAINGENDSAAERQQDFKAVTNLTYVVIPDKIHGNTPRDPAFTVAFAKFISDNNPN